MGWQRATENSRWILRSSSIFSNDWKKLQKSVSVWRAITSLLVNNRFFWTYITGEQWGDFLSDGVCPWYGPSIKRGAISDPGNSSLWQWDWTLKSRKSSQTTAVHLKLILQSITLKSLIKLWSNFKQLHLFPLEKPMEIWKFTLIMLNRTHCKCLLVHYG